VGDLDAKRACVGLGVVEGHFDIQVSEVAAAEPFSDAQRFAVVVAHQVESRPAVEARCFHYKDAPLPAPDRIAQERREVEFLRQRPSVSVDLAMEIVDFVKDDCHTG